MSGAGGLLALLYLPGKGSIPCIPAGDIVYLRKQTFFRLRHEDTNV